MDSLIGNVMSAVQVDRLIGNVISAVQVDASYDEDLETVEHTVTLPVGVSGAQTYCTRRTKSEHNK